ncbi:MAG: 5'-methylthioadenosine/S-adenosylhomocysteine nucleosidase, partial [Candidatus Hadarchaeales archaeon]
RIERGEAELIFNSGFSFSGKISASGELSTGTGAGWSSYLEQIRQLINLDSMVQDLQGKVSAPSLPDPSTLLGQLDLSNLVKSYKLEERNGKLCITADLNDLSTSIYGLNATVSRLHLDLAIGETDIRISDSISITGSASFAVSTSATCEGSLQLRELSPGVGGSLAAELVLSLEASCDVENISGFFLLSQLQDVPMVAELMEKYGVSVKNDRLYLTTSVPTTSTTLVGMNVQGGVDNVEVGLQSLHVHLSGSTLSIELSLDFNVAGGNLLVSGEKLELQPVLEQIRSKLPAGVRPDMDENGNLILEASVSDNIQIWGFEVEVENAVVKIIVPKVKAKLSEMGTIEVSKDALSARFGGFDLRVTNLKMEVTPEAETVIENGEASLVLGVSFSASAGVQASGTLDILSLVERSANLPVPSDLSGLEELVDLSSVLQNLRGEVSTPALPDPGKLLDNLDFSNLVENYELKVKNWKLYLTADLSNLSTSLYGLEASLSSLHVELAIGELDIWILDNISVKTSSPTDFAVSGSASLKGTIENLSDVVSGMSGRLDVDLFMSFQASGSVSVSGSFSLSQLQNIPMVAELMSKYGVTVKDNRLYLTTSVPTENITLAGMNLQVGAQQVEVGLENLHVHLSGATLSIELSIDFSVTGASLSTPEPQKIDLQSILDQIKSQLPPGVSLYLDANRNLVLEASSPDVAKQLWGFNVTITQPSTKIVLERLHFALSDMGGIELPVEGISTEVGGFKITVENLHATISPTAGLDVVSGVASISASVKFSASGKVKARGTLDVVSLVERTSSLPVLSNPDVGQLVNLQQLSNLIKQPVLSNPDVGQLVNLQQLSSFIEQGVIDPSAFGIKADFELAAANAAKLVSRMIGSLQEPVAIVGAMDVEVAPFRDQMVVEKTTTSGDSLYYEGTIAGKRVILAKSGVGKGNARACVEYLINTYQPAAVIFSGVAGSINPSLNIGDVVIVTETLDFDEGTLQMVSYPMDGSLVSLAERVSGQVSLGGTIVSGRSYTSDVVVDEYLLAGILWKGYQVQCAQMEDSVLAEVCSTKKVPVVSIRAVSDKVQAGPVVPISDPVQLVGQLSDRIKSYSLEERDGKLCISA